MLETSATESPFKKPADSFLGGIFYFVRTLSIGLGGEVGDKERMYGCVRLFSLSLRDSRSRGANNLDISERGLHAPKNDRREVAKPVSCRSFNLGELITTLVSQ